MGLEKVWKKVCVDKFNLSDTDSNENSDRYLSVSSVTSTSEEDTFDLTYRKSIMSNITGFTHFNKSS